MDIIRQPNGEIKQRFWMADGNEYRIDYEPKPWDNVQNENY